MARRTSDKYAPAKEQGILKEETSEEKELDMELGEKDEDVYTEEGREELIEDDEVDAWEEGFMEGAEGRGELAKCAYCGKVLNQSKRKLIEREINNELYLFCSESCAKKGIRK